MALSEKRIIAIEPHAATRGDIYINLGPLEELSNLFKADLLLYESSGDNLVANFNRELAHYFFYIIDVSVINKTYFAAAVGNDLSVMERDARRMCDGGPFFFAHVLYPQNMIHNQRAYFSQRSLLLIYLTFSGEAWARG